MTIDDRLNQAANSLEDDETGPPPFSEVRHRAARRRAVFGVAGALLLVLSGLGAFAATNDGRRIRISTSQVADGANAPTTYATTPPTTTASTPTSVRTTTTSIVPIVTAAAPPSTEALPPVTTEPVTTIPETTVPETTVPQTIETTMVTTPPTAAPTTEPVFAGCFMTEPGCANVAYEPDPQPNQPITLVGGATPRVEEHPYGAPTTFSPSWYIDVEFTLTEPDTMMRRSLDCASPITITHVASGTSTGYDYQGNVLGPAPCPARACGKLTTITAPPAIVTDVITTKFSVNAFPGDYTVTIKAADEDPCSPYFSTFEDRVIPITLVWP